MIFNFLIYFMCFMIGLAVFFALAPLFVFLLLVYGIGMLVAVLI